MAAELSDVVRHLQNFESVCSRWLFTFCSCPAFLCVAHLRWCTCQEKKRQEMYSRLNAVAAEREASRNQKRKENVGDAADAQSVSAFVATFEASKKGAFVRCCSRSLRPLAVTSISYRSHRR